MQLFRVHVLLVASMSVPVQSSAQHICVAPALSDQQVSSIVEKERAARTDLPAKFTEYRSTVRRQDCHYVYIEYGVPAGPERTNVFTLNQYGVIVDTGRGSLRCPGQTLTEGELADIVKNERARRTDLPPAFPNSSTRVDRLRCLYLYSERAMPETMEGYHVFVIDPLGELMEWFVGQP